MKEKIITTKSTPLSVEDVFMKLKQISVASENGFFTKQLLSFKSSLLDDSLFLVWDVDEKNEKKFALKRRAY